MLPTYFAINLPVISRTAPMVILTRLSTARLHNSSSNNSSKSIFEPDDPQETTASRKKIQQPDDQPWEGEEPIKYSVLRMIMDKYRTPLRVQGAAKRNFPRPQSNWEDVQSPSPKEEKSSQKKKMEREMKLLEKKQNRIMDAKDAAIHYASERKYPTHHHHVPWVEDGTDHHPISINDIGILSDEKILYAQAKGAFDNLPGRGKPIPNDPLLRNMDTTEYFMNRIIQRNGAAPPWVMMQQELDTDIETVRSQLNMAVKKCLKEAKANGSSMQRIFERLEKSYYEKEVQRLNKRVKSYNVMCPASVRKPLLELDKELKDVLSKSNRLE